MTTVLCPADSSQAFVFLRVSFLLLGIVKRSLGKGRRESSSSSIALLTLVLLEALVAPSVRYSVLFRPSLLSMCCQIVFELASFTILGRVPDSTWNFPETPHEVEHNTRRSSFLARGSPGVRKEAQRVLMVGLQSIGAQVEEQNGQIGPDRGAVFDRERADRTWIAMWWCQVNARQTSYSVPSRAWCASEENRIQEPGSVSSVISRVVSATCPLVHVCAHT